ncbi:KAP family P-loop NTPase fold protein [Shewanella mangrovisoli]|uniref:KAP family P-loop NTPase fold protein n=1 Tax=Shewanella mangrovisoli TaxID=2864211 RepID=UPI0035B75EDC
MESTTAQASFINQAKYSDWQDKYTFANCLLNRGEYGRFLADYITGENDGFVLNLNGGWGSGKTEFLKRFYSLLLKRNHPVIYIDAWESDFSKDPLTVVTSELLTQLEAFKYDLDSIEEVERFKTLCGRFIKGLAVGVSAYLSKQYLGDPSIIGNAVQQVMCDKPDSLLMKLSTEHQELVTAIQQIRITLGELASKLNSCDAKLPVIVLVDELDRCRPNYAIEMLEVIKHFFKTDNFVFVVATDTDQLVHSIAAVYGAGFDAAQYLKRFFDRKACLEIPKLENYLEAKSKPIGEHSHLQLFPIKPYRDIEQSKTKIIVKLAEYYELNIRDIDQLLHKLDSCLRTIQAKGERINTAQIVCLPALIVGLIEFDKGIESFKLRRQKQQDDFSQYKRTNIEVFSGLNIFDFIRFSVWSTLEKFETIEEYDGVKVKGLKTFSFSPLNTIKIGMENRNKWANDMVSTISAYSDNREQYWFWDDYRKVIELAGNIE